MLDGKNIVRMMRARPIPKDKAYERFRRSRPVRRAQYGAEEAATADPEPSGPVHGRHDPWSFKGVVAIGQP